MSLTLYFHPLASFCHKALIALYENETPFKPVIVDLGNAESSAPFRKLWPMAQMPVLRDDKRERMVAESTIVIEYLDTYYPGAVRFMPTDPDRAWQARMWDRFYDNYVQAPMQKIVTDHLRPAGKNDAVGVEQARSQLLFYANTVIPFGPAQKNLAAYLDRLMARPSFSRVLREAEPYFTLFPLEPKPQIARRMA